MLRKVALDLCYDAFRRLRPQSALLARTRPDIFAPVNSLSQQTDETFRQDFTMVNNQVIMRGMKIVRTWMTYLPTDRDTPHVVPFSDDTLATNSEGSSHLGIIMLLVGWSGKACVLVFVSRKYKRVVRSLLGQESFAFPDAVDEVLLLRHSLNMMLGNAVLLKSLTHI